MKAQGIFARPALLLQIEAFCGLVVSCVAYHLLYPHDWIMFGSLFLVPDASLLLYLLSSKTMASTVYNVVHSYVLPTLLGGIALCASKPVFGALTLIWFSHISMDRMLGYGLKYPTSFKFTHIQSAANSDAVLPPSGTRHR